MTVFETPEVGPVPSIGKLLCKFSLGRRGYESTSRNAFQAVTVSPDGSGVVFEVSDDFSVNPPLPLNLPADTKGIFGVQADGTALRRLGPASRSPFFFVDQGTFTVTFLEFSPNGRTITYVDRGKDALGRDADQVVIMDIRTGKRTQVTALPPALPPAGWPPNAPTAWNPSFLDDETIRFLTTADPDGLNPEGRVRTLTIKADGSHLDVPLPISVALPGATVDPRYVITGAKPQLLNVTLEGAPVNDPPLPGPQVINEVFVVDELKNALQLTSFGRVDTGAVKIHLDRQHAYFIASADPLGTNPSANCQLFSIDRLGRNLRQLTSFTEIEHSKRGCYFGNWPSGCAIGADVRQHPRTGEVIFYSSCDPVGTNPNGGQLFAIRPDGTGLRQLTDTAGLETASDGTVTNQLPGPWDYGPYIQ